MSMKASVRSTALLCFMLLILSCSEKEPYVFGYMSSLSGSNLDLGEAGRNGVLLAVEEFNNSGGINGRLIEVLIKDHQMDPGQLSHISGAFKSAGAEIVIGPFISGMTKEMLPIAEVHDLVILSPTASSNEFLNLDDMLLRINSSTQENTQYYADYLINKVASMTCSIIYDSRNESFTSSWLKDFSQSYEEMGGKILLTKDINSQIDTNFTPELELVRISDPGILLIVANSIDSATLVQQLRQIDNTLSVVVAEWAGTRQLIELGGKAVEGVVVLQSFDPFDESESYRAFHKRYVERFHSEPTFASIMSHDACHVLFQALRIRTEDQTIKSAILENGPYSGIQEKIDLNQFGDTKRKAVFSIVKDGQFRKIE